MSKSPAPEPANPPQPPALRGVPPDKRRAIVVGASSGMGHAIVRQLAQEGYRVAALARRIEPLDELVASCAPAASRTGGAVFAHQHDAARAEEVGELFESLVRELGGLDLLVFTAGIMPEVGAQEYDTATDLEVLRVNIGGCIAWCNPAANLFRTQRQGTIIGVSSVAGDRGRRGNPAYCTSKAAMNTYLESLRNRIAESGVKVCTIKPGFVDTVMTRGKEGIFWLISAETAAHRILAAARGGASVRYVPRRWFFVMTVIRSIPSVIFRKLDI